MLGVLINDPLHLRFILIPVGNHHLQARPPAIAVYELQLVSVWPRCGEGLVDDFHGLFLTQTISLVLRFLFIFYCFV